MSQFPVIVDDGKNKNGRPSPTEHPLPRGMLLEQFGASVKHLGSAVYLPLEPVVTDTLEWLGAQGVLPRQRVLQSLPHPSGANPERRVSYQSSATYQPVRVCGGRVKHPSAQTCLPFFEVLDDDRQRFSP
jgi:hypothetical protein